MGMKDIRQGRRLFDLPVELLYEIQIRSNWHALPLASKRLNQLFKSAPSSVCAEYLISRYWDSTGQSPKLGQPSLVSRSLRYAICTQATLDIMLGMPNCPAISTSSPTELPRRLFRSLPPRPSGRWSNSETPLPMLRLLYTHPRIPDPDPNSWDGYALTKAVAVGFIPLVQFLLDKGASPRRKGGLAVHAAIRRKDLALVKILIEPDPSSSVYTKLEAEETKRPIDNRTHQQRRDSDKSSSKGAKKRKLEDRVVVDQSMLKVAVACDAREIVRYFVQDKGCMPDVQTVRLMRFA